MFSLLILTVLASLFRDKGIIVLINMFFGLAVNAAYAIAMQVMSLTNTFVTNFKQSMVPQMMASYGYGDMPTMHRLINLGTKITFLLMLAISMPIMFECDYILRLWLGTPPEHSSELVILALVNVNIASFTYFLYQGVHATGNIIKQQSTFSFLYILNILLIYMFFNLGFSYTSALYVTISISVIQCIFNLYFARKTFAYDVKHFIFSLLPRCVVLVLISIFLFLLLTKFMEASLLRLCLSFLFSIILTIIIGLYIVFDTKEQASVKKVFNVYNRFKR